MFHCRVGESVRLRGTYKKSGVGVNVACTFAYTDEAGNLTNSLSGSTGALTGEVYYVLAPDQPGVYFFRFATTGDVDEKEIDGVLAVEGPLTAARAAYLDRLNSAISSHSAADAAAAVWAYVAGGGRSLTSFGTLVADVAAAVWAYTAGTGRVLTSFGTLVADTAVAVWGATVRRLTHIGVLTDTQAGTAIAAAGSASDPLLNPVPGAYAQGTAGAVLGSINPANVTVQSPVSVLGDALELVRGDDYFLADGRSLPFSSDDWPDMTGATAVTMTVRRRAEAFGEGSDRVLFTLSDLAASRVVGTGTQTVVFQPTAAMTALLIPGVETGKFDIQVTLANTHIITFVIGTVTTIEDQTR